MIASLDQILSALMHQAEQDAASYIRRRPAMRISRDALHIEATEMAAYRLPGSDDDEILALRACYVLAFKTAAEHEAASVGSKVLAS